MWPTFGSRLHYSNNFQTSKVETSPSFAPQSFSSTSSSPSKDVVHFWQQRGDDFEATQTAAQQVKESMALVPDDDKQEYLEASRLVPHLVATESDPLRFLRTEGMNPWSAATRLALYWKYRKEAFGERWLLPMDLSGNGALSPTDVANIRNNIIVVHRVPGEPTVLHVDFGRTQDPDLTFCNRAVFFASFVLKGDDIELQGIYVMQTLVPKNFMHRKAKGRAYEIVRKALPIRIRKVFIFKRQGDGLSDSIFAVTLSMAGMILEFFFGDAPEIISDTKQKEGFYRIRAYNIPPSCIPFFLGGSWDLQSGTIWPEETGFQQSSPMLSAALPSSSRPAEPTAAAGRPKPKRGRPPKVLSEEGAEEMKAECEDDAEFIKKRNALYSRRLYYKKKQEKAQLQEQIDELQAANEKLQKEHEKLESLLAEAQLHTAVSSTDILSGPAEMTDFELFPPAAIASETIV